MTTTRKVKAQMTREAILDVAEGVFYEMGLSGTTLEEIARRANVSRGAIYWHFTNKIEVFEAVFERTASFYECWLEEAVNKATSLQEFEGFQITLLHDLASSPEKQRALSIILLRHEHLEPRVVAMGAECNERILRMLTDFFMRISTSGASNEGIYPLHSAHVIAQAFLGQFTGLLTKFLMYPEQMNLERDAASLVRIFFHAIMAVASPPPKGK